MRKTLLTLFVLMILVTLTYTNDNTSLFFAEMEKIGVEKQAAETIFEKMPQDEKIVVLCIIAAKNNGDLDSLPPLKNEYEEIVANNPEAVNLIDMFFERNVIVNTRSSENTRNYYSGARWYYENDSIYLNFQAGRFVEYIELDWTTNSNYSNASVQVIADGYTLYSYESVRNGKQRFNVNKNVYNELFIIVRNAPVYVYGNYVSYGYDYNNNYEYGYSFIRNVNVENVTYVDINRTISDFKLKINQGSAYITKVIMNTNGRDYQIPVERNYYAGSSYDHNLARPAYVNYIRVEWNTYNRANAGIFVKDSYATNPTPTPTPNPGYEPVPSYVSVTHSKVSSPYQAENTYSHYAKIDSGSAVGRKVVETLTEKLRKNMGENEREALRALSRGNFVIRRVSSTTYRVIWW
ncbi:MAG: hypothetical protein WC002_05350 [Candidatus Muiribacteriota bacterium]